MTQLHRTSLNTMQIRTGSVSSESPPGSLNDLNSLKGVARGVVKKDALFRIFVYNKEHDETVAVALRNRHTKIQSIINSIVNRKNGWAKDRYFLINVKDEQILNPERTLSHYHVTNESMFILTRKNFRGHGPTAPSVSSKTISSKRKTKEKLNIMCSFGAPYDKQKLVSSYFGDASLNQYAIKIKEKFGMPQQTMITFRCAKFGTTQHGVPILGKHRECGLKELDIHANDEVLAQTNGVNLTLKPFHAPDDPKVVEMFSCFTLSMLRDQIEKELGIALKDQRWLIRSGGRLVRDDKDCGDICEYETITILSGCGCEGRPKCGHSVKAVTDVAPPTVTYLPTVQSVQTESQCVSQFGPSPVQLTYTPQTAALPALPAHAQAPMMMTSPMCAVAPKLPQYAHAQNLNLGNYAMWTPLVYGDYASAYGNCNVNFELGEQKDFDTYDLDAAQCQQFEFNHTANVPIDRSLKPCRNGNRCRFFLNPHIHGPCHFYHPPPPPTPPIANIDETNVGMEMGMCMPTAKPTNAAKRRRRRNRAKHY